MLRDKKEAQQKRCIVVILEELVPQDDLLREKHLR